jgi:hypothetical protein
MKFVYSLIFFSCLYSQSLIEGQLLDSLHIKLIRIDFKADQNPLTTGTGKFDSDSNLYALDPSGSRNTIKYWQQHLEFTKNYLSAASKGNLKLGWEIWPQEDGKAYTLSNEIIHYNRTQKREDEKQAAFDSTRVLKYLEFVQDAIWLVDSANADIFQTQSNTFYLILHAGSSRLIDGGSLGTQNVDTPGDFFDALVDKSSFNALSKHKDSARHKDSLGINTRNTLLEQVGVMAEHQSQDQLNWGSNGILLHILAQAIGLPLSYNIEQGSPMQGQFDLLDYAGAQTGKGFLPVLPAAWHRLYLGWDSLVVASPDSLGQNSYRLNPLSDSSYVLKIPINNQEYLLLENRSRIPLNDSVLTLKTFGNIQQTFPIDSLALALSDSICKLSCQKNTQQLKGVLESLSSYDMGLPGSGILVWHINEWAQDSVLGGSPINPWRTITTRHHYPVMSLVEADGLSSLGIAL